MPDLMIESARWCSTNEYVEREFTGSNGETYSVTLHRGNPGPYSVNWACTCPGFRFRGKCKHVTIAENENCGYGWEAACGSPEPDEVWEGPDRTCPKCGAASSVMSYAV